MAVVLRPAKPDHSANLEMGKTPPGQTRRRIFEFMRARLLAGEPPTTREVQEAFGFRAVQSAREHLEALVADGLLQKASGRARGYRLSTGLAAAASMRPMRPMQMVPLLGRVQAGALTTALEEPEGYLPISSRLPENELFALRVHGDSMRDAAILAGDIVIVRKQPSAASGDIVVALVGDEATVKRLRKRGRRVELVPENPEFEIIAPSPSDLVLLGKVIEVRRYLEPLPS
jgi:repressor LexA